MFSSSCAIYGEPEEIPISEMTPQNPVNPYGASKAMVERMLFDYQRAQRSAPLLFDISMLAEPIRSASLASCAIRKPTSFRGR